MQLEIVALFEREQLTEAEIAREMAVEEGSVVATLMQYSSVYKRLHRRLGAKEDKTEEEIQKHLSDYEALLEYSDDPYLKEKVLRNLIDEKRGRNDVALKKLELDREVANKPTLPHGGVAVFNFLLQKSREKAPVEPKEITINQPLEEELVCIWVTLLKLNAS